MNNNEQFRKSISEVINYSHIKAVISLQNIERELEKNPRSFQLKEERLGRLRTKQAYEHIKHHIDLGNFDSVEYWDKYIDPMSDFKKELDTLTAYKNK